MSRAKKSRKKLNVPPDDLLSDPHLYRISVFLAQRYRWSKTKFMSPAL